MKDKLMRLTFWRIVLIVLVAAGAYATFLRFYYGLGASTNLSDEFPWGIWIGFDVLCGVMLAAGGFTLMATVHIFNVERFRPICRPTLLTAFMGYILVVTALLYDLGRPYRIWHAMIMWNPHSVLFEVAWCVMLYNTVLALEFAPIVFERLRLQKAQRILHAISLPIVIVGIILSTLHQSSLGSLYLIMRGKLHPLWYSPLLPVFFFISAIAVGLAMTIFESSMSSKHFGRQLELPLLRDLGRILTVVLWVFAVLRIQDLYHSGYWKFAFQPRYETYLFWLEVTMALIIPLILLSIRKVRTSAGGLYLTSVLVVLGFITNRLNVSVTGMETAAGQHYIPKWTELAVTFSIIGVGFFLFALAAKYLPIFEEEEHAHTPAPLPPVVTREREAQLVSGD